jgi:glycosyltransferase involved in cell wall biosynthesis
VDGRATEVERYEHDGLRVVRYPVPESRSQDQHRGVTAHSLFRVFFEALQAERAQVFHLHSLTYGCNAHHLDAARALDMRTLVTAHMPNVVCMRGTLLRMGQEPCDGRVLESQCVSCDANFRGVPAPIAPLVAPLLAPLSELTERAKLPARVRTLLATPERVQAHAELLNATFQAADHIVAVCEWLRQALLANGAPASKLVLQRQGIEVVSAEPHARAAARRAQGQPLRVGYFGRANPVKGIDTLLAAVAALPAALPIELHLYAIAEQPEERATLATLKRQAARDPRIHWHAPVPPSRVATVMQEHDLIAIPSRWLETGPLVAMEAIALGIPVLGADRGGIAEIVEPGATGWLEPAGDVKSWTRRLAGIARGEDALQPDTAKLKLPSHADVADAMLALYAE